MKLYKFSMIAALAIALGVMSCSKENDLIADVSKKPATQALNSINVKGIRVSPWISGNEWNMIARSGYAIFNSSMPLDVAENGIVKLFVEVEGKLNQLPFETTVNGLKQYWYFQQSANEVIIYIDAYGTEKNPAENSAFKMIALEKEAIESLESKGHTLESIMSMPLSSFQNP